MDGTEVIVAIFGCVGVGKSTFISNALEGVYEKKCEAGDQYYITGSVRMCGRDVPVKIVEEPELTTRAILSIILFDITSHETYMELTQLLEMSHRVCPSAHVVVIGTKADLRKPHHVTTEEAESFCSGHRNGTPYYEIAKGSSDSISALFKEVLARPLINDHVLRFDTAQENASFVTETMEWALTTGSANILTHLRHLGYEISEDLIRKYDETVGAYLLGEYPPKTLSKFSIIKRPEFSERGEDSELDEDDEPQSIIDTRPSLQLSKTHLLQLSDISLTLIPYSFFQDLLPLSSITHVDFSRNLLCEIPVELCQLPSLTYLNLSHNLLPSLPSYTHWGHTHLKILNISHNKLTGDALSSPSAHKKFGGAGSMFFPKLWSIDISYNDLNVCPKWVLISRALMHLDLSGNTKIKSLPPELGLMSHLHTLLLNDLTLSDPPDPIPSLGTQAILSYLHYKHKSSQAITSLRVVLVGPESVGKTSLVARLKGDPIDGINPTKGLEVSEWKYKGDVLRRNMVTFDLWDFTGSSRYKSVYSCFDCKDSLHIAVFDINTGYSDIISWLSDIQSFSEERVPVLLVFTRFDSCQTREVRETEKKSRTEWVKYNMAVSKKPETSPAFTLLASSMSQTVKSLQDIDGRSSAYDRIQSSLDQMEFSGHIVPLMPLVITEPHFVSCTTGEGISQLRKTLYRIGVGSFRTTHPALLTIGIEIPTMYLQVEDLIRQLRGHLKTVKTEGELKPFHSFNDIRERLRRPLKQLDITASDFLTVLRFLHKRGVVFLHDSPRVDDRNSPVVAIDPQIIGFLLQRTIRSGEMHGEASILSGFLPNVHPAMIWGVDPVLFADDNNSAGITGLQLIDFLTSVDLCAPLVPGAVLIPSLLPRLPPAGTVLNLEDLSPKRVYILGYLPSFFWCHLLSRVLRSLAFHRFLQGDTLLTPSSPSSLPPRPANPLITPTGARLFLWHKHFVFEDVDGSKLWLVVYEGGQLGPESTQYCGRIDVLLKAATREKEAVLLRIVTEEIDQLLMDKYPSLLDDYLTPSLVDVLIPLSSTWFTTDLLSPSSSPDSLLEAASIGGGREEDEEGVAIPNPSYSLKGRGHSFSSIVDSTSLQSFSSIQGTLQEAFASIRATGTLPSSISSEEVADLDLGSIRLNPQSSLGGRQIIDETQTQTQYLVPAWECLQESFKSPAQQLRNGKLDFQGLIPDLLFADCPAQNFITPLEGHMIGIKVNESKGMFLRHYFSEKIMEPAKRHKGAQKTFYLKKHITKLYQDFDLLRNLTTPHIISSLGFQYSVPVLALELSPLGSVRKYLNDGNKLSQSGVHQIALQVLSAIKYLDTNSLNYHCLTCDNVLLWLLEPVTIKLSDSGLLHSPANCILCSTLNTTLTTSVRKAKMFRFNLIMFGLFLYELTLHRRAYEDIISLPTLILSLYHQQLVLNVEADLKHNQSPIKACYRLCMQSVIQLCIGMGDLTFRNLESRLSLCAGGNNWSPLKLTLDMEVLLTSPSSPYVYWASGSRGLVIGNIEPDEGSLYSKILAEAPRPESGLFANRRGKPIPIAVGHATAIDICTYTRQIWVGTENGLMGSVYVFNLPDFKSHHYIHLQDAVLSLKIMDSSSSPSSPSPSSPSPSSPSPSSSPPSSSSQSDYDYKALVGLANGTIIIFSGRNQERLLENPLQGPRRVVTTFNRKPCLGISANSSGHLWTACGNNFEVFEFPSMKSVRRNVCSYSNGGGGGASASSVKGEVIIYSGLNRQGVWSVARRSAVLRLWDINTGELKASFNVRNILKGEFNEITALVVRGHAVWMGTRSGYLFLLDASAIENQEQETAIKGFQYCGDGRVKGITPFPSSLKVLCSIEYSDEVSGCIMMWEYQSTSPKNQALMSPTQSLQPVNKYRIESEFLCDS